MSLEAGTQLGSFTITGRIGAGGMGEVYRATDTKLGRDVAIKTLPASLAADADRLARFEREAKLLASLNHAHIASVYSLDQHEGTLYIAMELVEGETLEKKLQSGPLPVDEALRFGLQIANALEAAHDKGVVHRDLKPANVMVTPDDVVKVLDFGLAKAFAGNPSEASPAHSPALSLAMTQQGLVLGTAGYMSPEQASGQATDQRADIWSFGVVLYEMLTGQSLFGGESVPHILAAVLKTEPDWARLPRRLNPRVRALLERCLRKKARNRYHSIADVRVDLEEALSDPEGAQSLKAHAPQQKLWTGARVAAAAAVLAVVAGLAGTGTWLAARPDAVARPVERFRVQIPPEHPIDLGSGVYPFGFSLDGRRLAYRAPDGVYVRELSSLTPRKIEGADDALSFIFSPDGQAIAYLGRERRYVRIPVSGGASVEFEPSAAARSATSGTWERADSFLWGHRGGVSTDSVRDGRTETLVALEADELAGWPQRLPGGESLLFSIRKDSSNWADGQLVVASLPTGERKVLIAGGNNARYVPTGHIVYMTDDNTLYGVAFDLRSLRVLGVSQPLVTGIARSGNGTAMYGMSTNGTLAYVSESGAGGVGRVPVTLSRNGDVEDLSILDSRDYYSPQLSPDGSKLAVSIVDGQESDIWVYDLARGAVPIRMTRNGVSRHALWMPSGDRLLYWVDGNDAGLYRRRADAVGAAELLWKAPDGLDSVTPLAINPAGTEVLLTAVDTEQRNVNVYRLSLANGGELGVLLGENFAERNPALSPDGRWLAYASGETGGAEIYVRPYPDVDSARIPISSMNGIEPHWSPDGTELYYRTFEGDLMVVKVDLSNGFTSGRPETLLARVLDGDRREPSFVVAPDGQHFVTLRRGGAVESAPPEIIVVRNWTEELKERIPVD